jgi:hypothetical protein
LDLLIHSSPFRPGELRGRLQAEAVVRRRSSKAVLGSSGAASLHFRLRDRLSGAVSLSSGYNAARLPGCLA